MRAAGRAGGLSRALRAQQSGGDIRTLAGRWTTLQLALQRALSGDHKGAASLCAVVRVASELRDSEGREAEIQALHDEVRLVIERRRPIITDGQGLSEPLEIVDSPTENTDQAIDSCPNGGLVNEKEDASDAS